MANTKQSLKRARQNTSRYKLRHAQRSMVRTAVKAVKASIEKKDIDAAKIEFIKATKILDSSASKKVIHKNAAARTKSRLSKAIKNLGQLNKDFSKSLIRLIVPLPVKAEIK